MALSASEKKHVESLLASSGDTTQVFYMGKIEKVKHKVDRRVLIVTRWRVYCMKPSNGKLARSGHLLDLVELNTLLESDIELIFKTFRIYVPSCEDNYTIVNAVRKAFEMDFANVPTEVRYKLQIKYPDKLTPLDPAQKQKCSVVDTYKSLCVYRNTEPRSDIIWDLENIHQARHDTRLKLSNFDQPLSQQDILALLETMSFSFFFTKLSLRGVRVDRDTWPLVTESIKHARCITSIDIAGVGATALGIAQFANRLQENKLISLVSLNLKDNLLEDKGAIAIAGYLQHSAHPLTRLNLSNTGIGHKGIGAIALALKTNQHLIKTLTTAILCNNKFGSEGSRALGEWLSMPVSLTHLDLSNTSLEVESVATAMSKGNPYSYRTVIFSGNNIEKEGANAIIQWLRIFGGLNPKDSTESPSSPQPHRPSLGDSRATITSGNSNGKPHPASFSRSYTSVTLVFPLSSTPPLVLDISNTLLPIDSLKEALLLIRGTLITKVNNLCFFPGGQMLGGIGSRIKAVSKLDLSDNDLGDEGVTAVCNGFSGSSCLEHLILNSNFTASRGKTQRASAIDALIQLISSSCPLKSLEMSGGVKSALKTDIMPFLVALGTNTTLTNLDISGHQMGNKGAMTLARAIQVNTTLTKLLWDDNGTTYNGFVYFEVGMKRNTTLVTMPMPFQDIHQSMKMETGDKTISVVKLIEKYVQRNALAKSSDPSQGQAPPTIAIANENEIITPDEVKSDPEYDEDEDFSHTHPPVSNQNITDYERKFMSSTLGSDEEDNYPTM